MAPGLRKLVLTAHITSSVGWLGAVAGFLAVALAARSSQDEPTMRAAYITMESMTRYAIVPLSLTSLVIGIVQSLASPWGLFRHYWVVVKLVLTIFAVVFLLQYTRTMSAIAGAATDPTMSGAGLRALGTSPLLHSAAALLILLVTTILAVYKPRGMTRYGWRRRADSRTASSNRRAASSSSIRPSR